MVLRPWVSSLLVVAGLGPGVAIFFLMMKLASIFIEDTDSWMGTNNTGMMISSAILSFFFYISLLMFILLRSDGS
jgi:hypothetical protein